MVKLSSDDVLDFGLEIVGMSSTNEASSWGESGIGEGDVS